jgi:peroxiredoxin
MLELGQLERRHEDFKRRNTRVIVVSLDGVADAAKTQADFPDLTVLSDEKRGLSNALSVIHAKSAPNGGDTSAPTTVLIDRNGIVRWVYRTPHVSARLSPDDLVEAIDQHLREARDKQAW